MPSPIETVDLYKISYEQFVSYLFDKPVVQVATNAGDKPPEPWYWHTDVLFDPIQIARFYIRLFYNPSELLGRFSREQLEQGFWAIQSPNLSCSVAKLIWEQTIPFEIRKRAVEAMFHLFEKLFAHDPLDSSVNMWWDSIAYDWHCGLRARTKGGEDLEMQNVMFETLEKILHLPSEEVRFAALHGFGHLHHPDTKKFIESWLSEHPQLSPEIVDYARAASWFNVM